MKRFDFQVAANIRPQPFQNPPPTTTSVTPPPAALHFSELLLVALSDSLILGCTTNRPFFGLQGISKIHVAAKCSKGTKFLRFVCLFAASFF
jgi:hypothetical protein